MNLTSTQGVFIKAKVRINEAIRASQVRVIGPEGSQMGIMSKGDALKAAQEHELDLVEISPGASPPVVKIIDWGKYQYQQKKQQQRNKKNSKASELKQMRFGLKIAKGDLDIKLRKVREFLEEGHKVRVSAFFRGREMAHKELGYQLLKEVQEELSDIAVADQPPQMAGRNLSIVLRSKPNAKAKNS